MKRLPIVLGCLLMAAPAFAQSVGEKSGANAKLGIAPATADFVKEVAISDMFEVEAGKLAKDKGNAAVKAFGSQMVTDHTKTSSELKALVSGGKVTAEVPPVLDEAHRAKLDKLKGQSGKDFNANYKSAQVDAHKDAVSLFERYAKDGENADLKAWAGKTLPALKHHLDMAQKINAGS